MQITDRISNEWQVWIAGLDSQVATLPDPVKIEWGNCFGSIPNLQKLLQQMGPIAVFETMNRMVAQGHIELHVRRRRVHGKSKLQCRYRMLFLGQTVLIETPEILH